jgi:hypothetical protein
MSQENDTRTAEHPAHDQRELAEHELEQVAAAGSNSIRYGQEGN